MKTCGIYVIKNNINNQVYVGQSVNIEARWLAHLRASVSKTAQDRNNQIHTAMRKLGQEHFHYEILEVCIPNQLNDKEIFWISKFDSYRNGYNMTPGGSHVHGENNPNSKLTKEDVAAIRTFYAQHIRGKDVYELYKNSISKSGFRKIWEYQNWLNVKPEVYTDENRLWHKTKSKGNEQQKISNAKRACSEIEIQEMRRLNKEGYTYAAIARKLGRSPSVVRKYCLNQESANPNGGRKIRNKETNLVFNSVTAAAKWASCERHSLSKHMSTDCKAGTIPNKNIPATWEYV